MAELPWVKSFVHLTAVALMAFLVTGSIKLYLDYRLYEISEKLQRKMPQKRESIKDTQNMYLRTGRHSILFGLGAMNRIDQASGKLIMQKYFQLLTTII